MKAWVFSGAGKPLELMDVPEPIAQPGEVVIDVKASGLCHSDVSALDDPNWSVNFPDHPVVLGHEPAGVVSAVGEGVTNLQVGDRVGVPSGPPNLNGYFRDGGYAEKTTALANAVVKIPDGLDFVTAASGTDAGNVAHHAVVTRGAGSRRSSPRGTSRASPRASTSCAAALFRAVSSWTSRTVSDRPHLRAAPRASARVRQGRPSQISSQPNRRQSS